MERFPSHTSTFEFTRPDDFHQPALAHLFQIDVPETHNVALAVVDSIVMPATSTDGLPAASSNAAVSDILARLRAARAEVDAVKITGIEHHQSAHAGSGSELPLSLIHI